MIHYIVKDITTVEKGVIAHGCNCQGVMGSGVALFLKQKYPQIFPPYEKWCHYTNQDLLGEAQFIPIKWETDELWIANCFTQNLYGKDGKYAHVDAIRTALTEVLEFASPAPRAPALDVYIPKIGAGRGGLDWATEVEPIIQDLANCYPETNIYVCSWKE